MFSKILIAITSLHDESANASAAVAKVSWTRAEPAIV